MNANQTREILVKKNSLYYSGDNGNHRLPTSKPMTIGQLSRRTGVSIKVLREYERLGFLYTLGRSESNYRLFDETTLWCVQMVQLLRSLGLTLKEIQEVVEVCLEHQEESLGLSLDQKLDQVLDRVEHRLTELRALRQRIFDFRMTHAAFLGGKSRFGPLMPPDPRRVRREQKITS
jgi:MerR family transcriptional regulator, copper efflux regulator